jgi:hypothetical protein
MTQSGWMPLARAIAEGQRITGWPVADVQRSILKRLSLGLIASRGVIVIRFLQGMYGEPKETPMPSPISADAWERGERLWSTDGLALEDGQYSHIHLSSNDAVNWHSDLAASAPRAAGAGASALAPERRTGRRPKWDWPGASAAFAAHLAQDPDGLPVIQADAERWVANWFSKTNGDEPPIQEIRSRVVAPVYAAGRSQGGAR